MWIKVDGCRRPEDAAAVAAAGADAAGMILSPGFRRSLGPEVAEAVRRAIPLAVAAVGVFVDAPASEVTEAARRLRLDAVQLHGREPEAYAAALRAGGLRVIRAWSGSGAPPLEADVVLIEPSAGRAGGTGRAWDWASAAGAAAACSAPVVLAGGLTPENVASACAGVRPWGVDVSSGVETDGSKDPSRIAAFCAAVRAWDGGGRGGACA